MSEPVLHKYFDFGSRALSNLSLRSGERVIISIVPRGFGLRRLHLRGVVPGRSLFSTNAIDMARMARVLARTATELPPLPQATAHRDDSAMLELLDAATKDLQAVAEKRAVPGAVDALDLDNRPERPLSLFTRLALAATDAEGLALRYERIHNLPG